MKKEDKINLELIKKELPLESYGIIEKEKWDRFSDCIAKSGSSLLKEIENKRGRIRKFKISLLFFRQAKQLNELEREYDEIAENFDLFFDASMRWNRSIVNKNEYEDYQLLKKKYIEGLTSHCLHAVEYLGNLIASRRNDYYHHQTLFIALSAIIVAITSILIGIIV